jgi:hypothetical protein
MVYYIVIGSQHTKDKTMTNEYTIGTAPKNVKVSEFRSRIQYAERLFHTDRQACVGAAEKAQNEAMVKYACSELMNTVCNRATQDDWNRRENIIDRAASHFSR